MIHDPAIGVRKLPPAEVSKHFTGVVLELTPAASFHPVHARAPIRLSSLWSQMTGMGGALAQVIALSVALQIAAFAAPFQIQLVVDEAVFHADQDLLVVLALAFGALVVVQASIEALRGWALRVFGHLLSFQIVGNLVRHMMRLPADFFEKRHVGDILSRIGAAQPIQDAITRGVVAAHHRRRDVVHCRGDPVLLLGDCWARSWSLPSSCIWACLRALSRDAPPDGGGDPRPRQGAVASHGDRCGRRPSSS